ncbi:HlyU family transcriptional regulator [Gymnodinialimonas sp. 57CJ19]|uniref:HlyU family transcriptional regulator n=1 Tax=Gymnodinialimonas sp. 57CJ19 TaxID=3138498 RepID=UPI0031342C30
MSLLSKLFGGGEKPKAEPVLHNDYRIFVDPQSEQGGFRVAARIEKDVDGETKVHQMIRADTCRTQEEVAETSLFKAKMLIDQQGDSIFR